MAPGNIKGRLLLVEQHFIDEFNERFPSLLPEYKLKARASLEMLIKVCNASGGRWKLAVIKTDVKAFELKLPVTQQIENLRKEKAEQLYIVKKLRLGIRRLERLVCLIRLLRRLLRKKRNSWQYYKDKNILKKYRLKKVII